MQFLFLKKEVSDWHNCTMTQQTNEVILQIPRPWRSTASGEISYPASFTSSCYLSVIIIIIIIIIMIQNDQHDQKITTGGAILLLIISFTIVSHLDSFREKRRNPEEQDI